MIISDLVSPNQSAMSKRAVIRLGGFFSLLIFAACDQDAHRLEEQARVSVTGQPSHFA
jgi:hypothetical protein